VRTITTFGKKLGMSIGGILLCVGVGMTLLSVPQTAQGGAFSDVVKGKIENIISTRKPVKLILSTGMTPNILTKEGIGMEAIDGYDLDAEHLDDRAYLVDFINTTFTTTLEDNDTSVVLRTKKIYTTANGTQGLAFYEKNGNMVEIELRLPVEGASPTLLTEEFKALPTLIRVEREYPIAITEEGRSCEEWGSENTRCNYKAGFVDQEFITALFDARGSINNDFYHIQEDRDGAGKIEKVTYLALKEASVKKQLIELFQKTEYKDALGIWLYAESAPGVILPTSSGRDYLDAERLTDVRYTGENVPLTRGDWIDAFLKDEVKMSTVGTKYYTLKDTSGAVVAELNVKFSGGTSIYLEKTGASIPQLLPAASEDKNTTLINEIILPAGEKVEIVVGKLLKVDGIETTKYGVLTQEVVTNWDNYLKTRSGLINNSTYTFIEGEKKIKVVRELSTGVVNKLTITVSAVSDVVTSYWKTVEGLLGEHLGIQITKGSQSVVVTKREMFDAVGEETKRIASEEQVAFDAVLKEVLGVNNDINTVVSVKRDIFGLPFEKSSKKFIVDVRFAGATPTMLFKREELPPNDIIEKLREGKDATEFVIEKGKLIRYKWNNMGNETCEGVSGYKCYIESKMAYIGEESMKKIELILSNGKVLPSQGKAPEIPAETTIPAGFRADYYVVSNAGGDPNPVTGVLGATKSLLMVMETRNEKNVLQKIHIVPVMPENSWGQNIVSALFPNCKDAGAFFSGLCDASIIYCRDEDCGYTKGLDVVRAELQDSNVSTTNSLKELIRGWVNFALGFLFITAVLAVIVAGYMMVAHFGNDDLVSKAKNIIKYAVIGIIVILLAYPLVNTVVSSIQ
jgi:hypothetical protein